MKYILYFAYALFFFSCGSNIQNEVTNGLIISRELISITDQDTALIEGTNWQIISTPKWLTIHPTSGIGKTIITLKTELNSEWVERETTIFIKNEGRKIPLKIVQAPKTPIEDNRIEIPKDEKRIVKVISVYEDPLIGEKYLHQYFPPSSELWFNPRDLNKKYKAALEECSGGVVEYQIVREIEATTFFTNKEDGTPMIKIANDLTKTLLNVQGGPANYHKSELLKTKTQYDYRTMIEFYGFDTMRDNEEVHEIWVWSYPGAGSWESTYAGKDAWDLNPMWNSPDRGLWLNSWPVQNVNNQKLLVIMGLNYERNLACAMESYGHRAESVMWQVYGRWDRKNENPNNWEIYTRYDFETPNKANVGNIHYTATGTKDYEWANKRKVISFANAWRFYPDIRQINPDKINCSAWNCDHESYMRFWFSQLPNRKGINPKDGRFNNWWRYIVNYSDAVRAQKEAIR